MSLEHAYVIYPSEKLIPILEAAIASENNWVKHHEGVAKNRTKDYKELVWYKKIFADNPDVGIFHDNCITGWTISDHMKNIREMNDILLAAKQTDSVRILCGVLSRITEISEEVWTT